MEGWEGVEGKEGGRREDGVQQRPYTTGTVSEGFYGGVGRERLLSQWNLSAMAST